jgi:hypothetical protein
MSEIRFLAVVGEDQTIRPPAGISIRPGEVEVLVRPAIPRLDPTPDRSDPDRLAKTREWLLAMAAKAEAIEDDLPSDMAENHDHYTHRAPKR